MIFASNFKEIHDWQWKHFTPQELACHGTGEILISEVLLDKLERLRGIVGKSLIINSAYRSPIWNATHGGAPMSQHKFGTAVDISTRNGVKKEVLIQLGKDLGFTGIGYKKYPSWVHLDIRNTKYIAYW